jgi:formylglycine-generating enzyme required for sulfatase activity
MSDIFVSYASEDRQRVQSLAQALEKKGWSVWWDRRIPIGRSFDEVIEEALDGSKVVVVVWTNTSVKSQWVKNEAREGLRRRVLFPVMLVEEVRIPLEFRDVQTAHLMDWQPEQEHAGFDQFVDDLAHKIGAPVSQRPTGGKTTAAESRPKVGPSKEIIGKDSAPMVLVPAGSFLMGSTKDEVDRAIQDGIKEMGVDQQTCEGWYRPELPQHKVQLDSFYLDKYELTNRLFAKFVEAMGYRTTAEKEGTARGLVDGTWKDITGASWRQPEGGVMVFASNRLEHPVVSVSWEDADAYCRWAGKRLPTEAEFEYATRAGTQTTYWWGNGTPGARRTANMADEFLDRKDPGWVIMSGYDDGAERTAPVGSYEANPFGLHDMTGNVSEWTSDWYGGDFYGKSPARNPTGPSSGQY